MSETAKDRILPLARRWAIDWICGQNAAACEALLSPGYTLRIGEAELAGRETYTAATSQQFKQFPGLVLTVHEVLSNGTQAAIRFTEHGASLKHEGRAAAWTGVALLEGDGARLTRGWADENYLGRRRQLASGSPDPVAGPAVAPWDTPAEAPNPETEAVVRAWLLAGLPTVAGLVRDDSELLPSEALMQAERGEAEVVFSAGRRAAFHGRVHGRALGAEGKPVSMSVSGLVAVAGGRVAGGTVVSDRLGLMSALRGGGR